MESVAAPWPDVLLATKLHVPRPRPGFVPRRRLAAALDEGAARGRALVCAPAGFGKTSLLADWARGTGRPVAWLGLDGGDSDPARFWRYLLAAVDKARPGLTGRIAPLLGPPSPRSFAGLVTALINELAADPGADDVLLVLDDYHLVDSAPVHESLAFLLENLPPGLLVVVSGRADPPLPLARLRAHGQLAELRAADLRFTDEEAAALLRAAAGPDLPDAAVAALLARTEGWAAGLQLAGLSLQTQARKTHADAAGFATAFSGSHRFVLDYLTDEVLDGQPAQVRAFLLETSVLDRLSGELCDAVTGRPGGQAMLQDIERAGLFLVPLDEVRGWWRYHHLFADLLRTRLQAEQPARVPALHRAAARWCDEHDLADDAVRHTLAAGDAAAGGRLVERHAEALLGRGEGATLRRWLAALPAETVRERPRLCLARAYGAAMGLQMESIEALLDDAERAYAVTGDEPHESSIPRAASVLANVPAAIALLRADLARLRGAAAVAAGYGGQALDQLGEEDWLLRCFVRWNLAIADWLQGRPAPAERSLSDVLAKLLTTGLEYLAMEVRYDLGLVQRALGHLDAATANYQQAITAATGGRELPYLGMAHVGLAEVLYERDELAAALDHATRGIALCRQLTFTQPLATGLAALARIRQAQGDAPAASEAMDEAVQVELSPQVVALLNPVPSRRARLLLAQGEVQQAAEWAKATGLSQDDGEPDYPREPEYLVLARVLLAEHDHEHAAGLLQRLLDAATSQHRTGSVIEIQVLRARALAASGSHRAADQALTEARTLAGRHGYARVFADEDASQRPARTVPQGMAEPLTDRELEVLRLLAAGKSNQRIAYELVVALDTVKKHVTHVLGKLGAANRTEAAARARQLGLIP